MPEAEQPLRVWDLPTRVFHWTLAATVLCSVVTAKIGGNALVWHFRLGYLVMALLIFRIVWGFVGGHWSRFARYLYSPAALLRYVRDQALPHERFDAGHSPLGILSVLALLTLLAVQVGTGLVADDEIASVGPLNRFVSGATASAATGWHKGFGQWLILGMIGLHLAAVAFYVAVKGKPLVAGMVAGHKPLPAGTPETEDTPRTRVLALMVVLVAAGIVSYVVALGG